MQQLNKALLALFILVVNFATAQNKQHPWMINAGLSGPQMTINDRPFFKEYFHVTNWNLVPSFNIKASRHLKYGFSPQATFSIGYANRKPLDSLLGRGDFGFVNFDVNMKYSFANGYILKEKCWFDPYAVVGVGVNYFDQNTPKSKRTSAELGAGLGVNLWMTKNIALFIQASYKYMLPTGQNTLGNYKGYMHHTMGLAARFGKGPDKDKDGVPDAEDKCPDVPGKAELSGCPDTDGDGITDAEDKCPAVAGLAAMGGCPDTDGDGITDANDACPTIKGEASMQGCPDTDGDGVADKDDACPTIKGLAYLQGCPDSDGDGVADSKDACPTIKGLISLNGCPDADGDGIADASDKCPNEAGPVSNNGCPENKAGAVTHHTPISQEVRTEVQKKLSFAAKNIEFETGSDIIRKSSYNDLDNVANIMTQYPSVTVNIDGHTDNVGKEQANVDLSMKRAVAVNNFLMKKGVAAHRLTPAGFGPFKPIAPNTTAEGKQKNRRVELNIKN